MSAVPPPRRLRRADDNRRPGHGDILHPVLNAGDGERDLGPVLDAAHGAQPRDRDQVLAAARHGTHDLGPILEDELRRDMRGVVAEGGAVDEDRLLLDELAAHRARAGGDEELDVRGLVVRDVREREVVRRERPLRALAPTSRP